MAPDACGAYRGSPRRDLWLATGELPLRGARVLVKPSGATYLAHGNWSVRL
ncbi:hypothetical protein [Streptomyces abikoensis]|uniref:hypothetical protein n=1 Tax=Streptomyces abikoensis TaxID=97398 RepID=UPI003684B405